MKFRAKGTIEAEQFVPPHKIPKGVFNVYEMTEGVFGGEIETTEGRKYVISGLWIAEEPDNPGKYYPIYDNVIQEKYEPDTNTWDQACETLLSNLADEFLKHSKSEKLSYNDQAVFQAIAETIKNYPYPKQ